MMNDKQMLQSELAEQRRILDGYLDLIADQADDESYVARGNGFCDAKYSDDFLQGQIDKIRQKIASLEKQIKNTPA